MERGPGHCHYSAIDPDGRELPQAWPGPEALWEPAHMPFTRMHRPETTGAFLP